MRTAIAAIAYAATHLLASARPNNSPMTGIATQKAQRARQTPIQRAANSA